MYKGFDAEDPAHLEVANKIARERREGELRDLRAVLNTEAGRRLYWRYVGVCGVFHQSFAGDPGKTAFNCGKQEIGLRLLADLQEAKPDAFVQMQNEEKIRADVEETRFLKEVKNVR